MALERFWEQVLAKSLISDGGADGSIVLSDVINFKVKQKVKLQATGEDDLLVEIKKIVSPTKIYVGPLDKNINSRLDISAYTVAKLASISSEEQGKVKVPKDDQYFATYAQEPIVARRVINVDPYGDFYTVQNPIPVQLSDGSIDIGTVNAELEVQLSHKDNDPDAGDVHDSVRIGDGEDLLAINDDGSINVVTGDGAPSQQSIQVVPIATADTDVEVTLPDGTKRYFIRVRDHKSKAKLGTASGDINAGNYWTIERGTIFDSNDLSLPDSSKIYIQTTKGSVNLEVISMVLP